MTAIATQNPPVALPETLMQMITGALNFAHLIVSGSFFESVPSGGDAYMMKHIIHDWNEQQAIAILKNCHQVMPENGKLLVIEDVLPPANQLSMGKLLDLEMLLMTNGGRERTETEFEELFAAAGFNLTRIVPAGMAANVIEGVKA